MRKKLESRTLRKAKNKSSNKSCICDSALFAAYVNMMLLANVGGPLEEEDHLQKHWKIRMCEYSMQDWITVSLPYMVTMVMPLTIMACLYDPTMRLLLYAAFAAGLQNWAIFGLVLVEEARFIMVMSTIVIPVWQLQVISYDLVIHQLHLIMRRIQNGNHGWRSVYMFLRSLQLYISILNKVNRYLIFACKLSAHFREHPVFGILYYFLVLDCTLVYTLIYGKAFKIPRLFDQAATSALLHMRGLGRGAFKRQIMSIPSTGIKVGSFHTLERASTPIYMDFVVQNIVNLLVIYG